MTIRPFSNPIGQLLRRNISAWQLAGYAIANTVGLGIILVALMFYSDATTSLSSSEEADPFFSPAYEVISKRVEGIGPEAATFSPGELAELEAQPWARRVGPFTSSRFSVSASIDLGGRSMSTLLFMESIPDEFFDIRPSGWSFDPANPSVPIVMSNDYLALYNFGLAAPQGLPQLSREVIQAVPLRFTLSGDNGARADISGRIAGFSSRLNTIAVPQSFMEWANDRFAPGEASPGPSRLIVETDQLLDTEKEAYLKAHGLESSADTSASASRLARFTTLVSGVVAVIGGVISLMAVFILFLSIFLIMQKSRGRLRRLMLLGYSPGESGAPLCRLVALINSGLAAVAFIIMLAARRLWAVPLADLGLGGASVLIPAIVAAGFAVAVTLVNIITIRRHIRLLW